MPLGGRLAWSLYCGRLSPRGLVIGVVTELLQRTPCVYRNYHRRVVAGSGGPATRPKMALASSRLRTGGVWLVSERSRVKRLAAGWRSRPEIEPNTVGRSLRFGTTHGQSMPHRSTGRGFCEVGRDLAHRAKVDDGTLCDLFSGRR